MVQTSAAEFNAVDLIRYLRSRRLFLAVACVSALLLAGVASLLLPKRYTATASIVIEPPAGMDPRSATALSPVYLESLKTYENLVSSDTLFLQALDYLRIRQRYAGVSIESLKRSVLRVSKPVNTRIIEIGVTLDNPRQAQQLAAYIAEHAAALNKAIDERSAADTAKGAEAAFTRAEERLASETKKTERFVSSAAGLDAELANLSELKFSADRDRNMQRAELAGTASKDRETSAETRATVAELDRESNELQDKIASTAERVDRYHQQKESLDADLKAARAAYEAARTRLDEIKLSNAFRGERLEVLDAGIVPQRPSSPDLPLNMAAALLIALTVSISYLALCFGLERARLRQEQVRGLW